MIRLHSVNAVNYRSLGDVTFTPLLGEGLTAIIGPNGSGKTSIVSATLWALYGITPDGMNVRDLRRQGTTSDDECRVTVTFDHDGQTVAVTRMLKGSKDATYASVTVDGVESVSGSVRAVTEWVTARLGVDAEGFLASVLVQQKQVDALVTSPPRERRALVERLARIDAMGQAVTSARRTALDAQRILDACPGTDADVTAAEAALTEAMSDLDAAAVTLTDATAAAATAQDAFTAADTLARDVAAAMTAHATAKTKVADATTTAAEAAARVEGHTRDIERLAAAVGTTDDTLTVEDAQAAVAAAESERRQWESAGDALSLAAARADAANSTLVAAERAVVAAHEQVTLARNTLTARVTERDDLAATLASLPTDLDTSLAELTSEAEALTAVRGAARADYTRLTNAITTLQATHEPQCPTCHQPIPDLSDVVTLLTEERATVQTRGEEANAALEEIARRRELLETTRAKLVYTQHALQRAQDAVTVQEQAVADATTRLANAKDAAAAAAQAADDTQDGLTAAQAAAQAADGELVAARERVTQATERLYEVRQRQERRDELAAARAAIQPVQAALDQAQADLAAATAELAAITVPPSEEQEQIRANWRAAADANTAAAEVAATAAGALAIVQAQVERSQERLAGAREQQDARADARATAEKATATRDALEAFRKDRLQRLAPELAEATSDLVNRMTGGKYHTVLLDEDFTPTVVDTAGLERPVGWLSGGEESLVALALRIALGDIVFGGRAGLLVLDEVLSAMDEQRRDAILSAIRDLPGRQVIMINHIPEAADIGDLVLRVEPTADGSTLVPVDRDVDGVHLDALAEPEPDAPEDAPARADAGGDEGVLAADGADAADVTVSGLARVPVGRL